MSFELVLLSFFFFSPLRALHSPVGRVKVLWEVETDDQCRKKAAITRRRRTEPFGGCHQGPRHALNMSGRPDTQSQTSLSRATPWLASPCAPRSEENGRGLSLDFRQREIFSGIQIGLKIIIIIIIIKCRKTSRWLAPNHSCSPTSFSSQATDWSGHNPTSSNSNTGWIFFFFFPQIHLWEVKSD